MNVTPAQRALLEAVCAGEVRHVTVPTAFAGGDEWTVREGPARVRDTRDFDRACWQAQEAGWIDLLPSGWWGLTDAGRAVLATPPDPQPAGLTPEEARQLLQAWAAVWQQVIKALQPFIARAIEDFRALAAYIAAHPEIFEPPPTSPPDEPHD